MFCGLFHYYYGSREPARFRQSYCHVGEKYADLKNTNWGDPNNKRRISIEEEEHNYELLVTKSLHSAKQHIAMDAQFWIDAVCINQDDDVAKLQARKFGKYLSIGGRRKFVDWRPSANFLSLFAFSALTKRTYWGRVWIQQELQASQDVWFHY